MQTATRIESTMRAASSIGLLLAVFSLGIMAGFFGTYSANVNLATLEFDGPTYALAQSSFNRNVRHPLFFAFFFGPPVWCVIAMLGGWRTVAAWWWLTGLIALGYTLGIIFFTREVNLPLNQFTESWTPTTLPANWTATRDAWNRANLWRAGFSVLLFAASLVALSWRTGARDRSGT
jgi:uncharacterized membrane protein